jgi:hypothetical protein
LLGAVKTSNGWVYEIVDGDKTSEGRTTGDVAFHLSATSDKNTVYLIYDSVLTINSNRDATSGEVRLATRKAVFPEDWRYQTLDGPENGNAVAGYATAIFNNRGRVFGVWLASRGDALPKSTQVILSEINSGLPVLTITPEDYGSPGAPLSLNSNVIVFGCSGRLCTSEVIEGNSELAHGGVDFSETGALLTFRKRHYMVIAKRSKLVMIKL